MITVMGRTGGSDPLTENDPLTYGGGFVFMDEDGTTQWWFWDGLCLMERPPKDKFEAKYRTCQVQVPRHVVRELAHVDLEGVARFFDMDVKELWENSAHTNTMNRVLVLEVINNYDESLLRPREVFMTGADLLAKFGWEN